MELCWGRSLVEISFHSADRFECLWWKWTTTNIISSEPLMNKALRALGDTHRIAYKVGCDDFHASATPPLPSGWRGASSR